MITAMMMRTVLQAEESGEPECDHIGYFPFKRRYLWLDGQTYNKEKAPGL
jgi:hypothetical protein